MNLQEYYKKLQRQHEKEMLKLQMEHKFQLEKIKTVSIHVTFSEKSVIPTE